ncbi:pectate lyase (plasmid) [Pedobacter sp. BS3]|uniref:pectate lyase family protein n=1 Tax=Pedobacter sp. BS3 TaxID=2567937 RepID=UPI0011EEFCC1|nr:pectate lyase [Pedobacter sp. BS3]TZF86171.1 pectate lyase [Pedobacter sp. BS3]
MKAIFLLLTLFVNVLYAQVPAFPGAEGFGKYTTGGRGGKVLMVTNVNDSGPGSLREAVKANGPRIIVFTVSGTIALQSPLSIKNGDVTIAGQSAPGDGICLKNYTTHIDADNVIIRYIRFRLGDESKQEDDAINSTHNHRDIIIDHCSMSWSVDECASFYRNHNFTLQWCIIAEALNHSVHSKGPHGYGGIWGGEGASYHHNLIACNNSRNPRFSGSSTTLNPEDELVDFSNNVIFNWGQNSSYGGEKGRYNMVNNYYKPGPATSKSKRQRMMNPWSPYGKFYIAGNIMEGSKEVSADNWKGVEYEHGQSTDSTYTDKPFPVAAISLQKAHKAYTDVLAKAGASITRDAVDKRIIEETRLGMATAGVNKNGLIDSQNDVGGWPELKSLPAPADTDRDGMPDVWEKKMKLDPAKANANGRDLDKNYDNIEVYLNSLVPLTNVAG